jgi:rod shape determining protein RodA
MKRRVNIIKSLDWITILLFMVFLALGWINIFASEFLESTKGSMLNYNHGKQLLWIIFALGIAIMLIIIDSKFYSLFAYPTYAFMILLLIAVLLFGTEIKGAKSWLKFGFIQIQPSEFAKFATCLALARFLSTYNKKIHQVKNLGIIFLIIVAPAFFIFLQPDAGSMLVYFSLLFVLYREGLSSVVLFIGVLVIGLFIATLIVNKFIIILLILGISAIVFWLWQKSFKQTILSILFFVLIAAMLWLADYFIDTRLNIYNIIIISSILISGLLFIIAGWYKVKRGLIVLAFMLSSIVYTNVVVFMYGSLKPYQQKRINVTLGIETDISGAGWNLFQSKLAIGSGGLTGKGFLQGTQTKGDYVPEQSTDFIFCTIGEEWGFIGTTVVILLYAFFLIRLIHLAERQRSDFTRIYGYGVVSVFFAHIAINVAMTIGLFPVIGIPLPFLSYGGSSLWGFTILLFVFLRLDASRLEYLH